MILLSGKNPNEIFKGYLTGRPRFCQGEFCRDFLQVLKEILKNGKLTVDFYAER